MCLRNLKKKDLLLPESSIMSKIRNTCTHGYFPQTIPSPSTYSRMFTENVRPMKPRITENNENLNQLNWHVYFR